MVSCKPRNEENLFAFIARLNESVAQVKRMAYLAEDVGEKLEIPNWLIVLKMLSALSNYPQYDHYVNNLLLQKKGEWFKLTPENC